MKPIADWLRPCCHCVNIDLPGHGHSPPPPRPWGVPEFAEIVRLVVERFISDPFSIVAHSNGGRIALYLASEGVFDKKLTRLALISPSGIRRRRSLAVRARIATAKLLKFPFELLPETQREFGLDWLRHSLVWRMLGSADYRNVEGVMRETFVRTVNTHLEDRLGTIDVPVLVFRGETDADVSSDQMQRLVAGLKDAGLVSVPDAGHYSYLDQPAIVRAGILEFLGVGNTP